MRRSAVVIGWVAVCLVLAGPAHAAEAVCRAPGAPFEERAAQLRPLDTPPRADLVPHFSPATIERAEEFRATAYALRATAIAVELLVLAMVAFGARRLTSAIARRAGGWLRAALALAVLAVASPVIVTLPIALARHAHARAAGLATDPAVAFLGDVARALGFAVALGAIAAVAFVGVARRFPRRWPAIVAAGGAVLVFVLALVFPIVYEPVFNDFRPVSPETRERVLQVAEAVGVDVDEVLVADASRRTTTLNAYVSGLGATKRVVLYDTLLAEDLGCELDVLVAHELAHVRERDGLTQAAWGAGGVIVAVIVLWRLLASSNVRAILRLDGAADPRVIPFLAFFIAAATLVTQPIANAISRHAEARADRIAVTATGCPRAAVDLEVRLAARNLADLDPEPVWRVLFFTHPPVAERIQIALDEEWRRARAGEPLVC